MLALIGQVMVMLVVAVVPAQARRGRAAPVSELVEDAGSGRVLFSANAERVRPPASLAKMMTLLLTDDAIAAGRLSPGSTLVMSRYGARQAPTRLGLSVGGRISVATAMRVVAVISANDIAAALAERVGGTPADFVAAMNRRAARLRMTGTRFDNPTGLAPSASVTTARDMALLGRTIIARPRLYRLFATRSISWAGRRRPNHNRLLGHVPGVDGLKTGYTVPAGFNLVASGLRDRRRVIVVVLGAPTAAARDLLVSNLLEQGFSSLGLRRPPPPVHRREPPTHRHEPPARRHEQRPSARHRAAPAKSRTRHTPPARHARERYHHRR